MIQSLWVKITGTGQKHLWDNSPVLWREQSKYTVEFKRNEKQRNDLSKGSGKDVIFQLDFFFSQSFFLGTGCVIYSEHLTYKEIHD